MKKLDFLKYKKQILLAALVTGMSVTGVTGCSNKNNQDLSTIEELGTTEELATDYYYYKVYKKEINNDGSVEWEVVYDNYKSTTPLTTYQDDYWYEFQNRKEEKVAKAKER